MQYRQFFPCSGCVCKKPLHSIFALLRIYIPHCIKPMANRYNRNCTKVIKKIISTRLILTKHYSVQLFRKNHKFNALNMQSKSHHLKFGNFRR